MANYFNEATRVQMPNKNPIRNYGSVSMKRLLLFYVLFSVVVLSSCVGNNSISLRKKYVKWTSQDDVLQFDIQGPFNEENGYGTLRINDEYIIVKTYLNLGVGPLILTIYEFEDQNMLLEFEVDYVNKTTLNLTVQINETNLETFDNLQLTITRTDISEEDLDAKKYLYANFVNEEYGIKINGGYLSAISRSGEINYNNQVFDIRIDYLNDNKFEAYDSIDNELLFSGQYISTKEYIELILDSNDYYPSSLGSIILEIVQPDL